jgi:hypothetical protein
MADASVMMLSSHTDSDRSQDSGYRIGRLLAEKIIDEDIVLRVLPQSAEWFAYDGMLPFQNQG